MIWRIGGRPPAKSYFARVKKEHILAAIAEGTGETEDLEALRKLKKSELVATAEARLADDALATRDFEGLTNKATIETDTSWQSKCQDVMTFRVALRVSSRPYERTRP